MSLHVAVYQWDPLTDLLRAQPVASATLASSGNESDVGLVPNDGRSYVVRLTAEVKMYVGMAQNDANSAANPRDVMLAGTSLVLAAQAGFRVQWETKA